MAVEREVWVQDVGDEAFEKEVLERSHTVPVVVDFWAEWCGPCRVLGPVLEKLADEFEGRFVLAKVDVDRSPQWAQTFGVHGIPAVKAFRDGELHSEFTGALPEPAVRQFLEKICPSEADEIVNRADALHDSEEGEAEMLYREALALQENHERARVGLAEVLLSKGASDEAKSTIEGLELAGELGGRLEHLRSELALASLGAGASEDELRRKLDRAPHDAAVLLELGKLLASERRFEEALQTLYSAAQADRKLAAGVVKTLMVEIFHVIGVRSELADDYRAKLSRLLY